MTRLRAFACAVTLLTLSGVGRAQGQTLALSSATVTFPSAGVAQLNAGSVQDAGITVSVDPGGPLMPWTLSLSAGSATLSPAGKPASDLRWRLEGSNSWTSIGTTGQAIATGVGPQTVKVYLRTVLRWAADGPGSYGTDITYSLTTS